MQAATASQKPVFGHPPGLFVLFFAEMWERFSYYGMRALLVFYMIKGFLKYDDGRAYAVYGAYTALVYATPFIGGMLADRLLGARRAVVLGGLLMAAGHLVMTIEHRTAFFIALALIICGNGFFKPNIGTIVGSLYRGDLAPKRDGGFTIFYMGVNLGAALSPLLCGYIGENYGWHYGFGLATIGMLVGIAVFVAPVRLTQIVIGLGAGAAALIGAYLGAKEGALMFAITSPVLFALVVAALVAVVSAGRGGLPDDVGRAKDPERLSKPAFAKIPFLSARAAVYLGIMVAVPLIALLVTRSIYAGYALGIFGGLALLSLLVAAIKSEKVERERLFVVLILMFFSMLFWAFFEQAGSSVNNFTDRNVDRVVGDVALTQADVGQTKTDVKVTQEFVGFAVGAEKVLTLPEVESLREKTPTIPSLAVTQAHVGMGVGGAEIKASVFQAANPIFILVFGLLFTMLWGGLAKRKLEPSTPVKFGLGLLQLGLGFGALWYGAQHADSRGMVGMSWLLLGYLLQTTGELCISPVGLSMVTKLSPARMVSTVLGAWYLATAFSNFLAGIIASLTGVGHGESEGAAAIPLPIETVHVYGGVFGQIAVAACISAVIVFGLAPFLTKWMHADVSDGTDGDAKKAA